MFRSRAVALGFLKSKFETNQKTNQAYKKENVKKLYKIKSH